MNSRKQVSVSTDVGQGCSLKCSVKYKKWRMPEITFAALSFVYLKPWVTLFCWRRLCSCAARSNSKNVVNCFTIAMFEEWGGHQLDLRVNKLSGALTSVRMGWPLDWK